MNHVTPGEVFIPQADTHNALVDLLMEGGRRDGAMNADIVHGNEYIHVKNNTGADIERYRLITIGGILTGYTDDDTVKDLGMVFEGVTASSLSYRDRANGFAVTQEAIADGEIGTVLVHGVTPCYVNFDGTGYLANWWVKAKNDTSGAFEVANNPWLAIGRLLWYKSLSAGEQLSVIRFPECRDYGFFVNVTAEGGSGDREVGLFQTWTEVEYNATTDAFTTVTGGKSGGTEFIKLINSSDIDLPCLARVLTKRITSGGVVVYTAIAMTKGKVIEFGKMSSTDFEGGDKITIDITDIDGNATGEGSVDIYARCDRESAPLGFIDSTSIISWIRFPEPVDSTAGVIVGDLEAEAMLLTGTVAADTWGGTTVSVDPDAGGAAVDVNILVDGGTSQGYFAEDDPVTYLEQRDGSGGYNRVLVGGQPWVVYYGKPTASTKGSTSVTLDPCSEAGVDNGKGNISAKCHAWHVFKTTDVVPYIFTAEGNFQVVDSPTMMSGVIPVICTKDGGSAGGSGGTCSYTYTIKTIDNTITIDTLLTPKKARYSDVEYYYAGEDGSHSSYGIATYYDGTWILLEAFGEHPKQTDCP